MEIEVVYALPKTQVLVKVDAPTGCTVAEAIELSGIRKKFPGLKINPSALGVFSRKVAPDYVLSHGDRVEIYRPLVADPKEMRKQRARRDALRTDES
jgi:putative ubiquitin-RnfH superfamily antitoxin RatB of RatAB toxin-antitoxin module